jgi:hypothetical protein
MQHQPEIVRSFSTASTDNIGPEAGWNGASFAPTILIVLDKATNSKSYLHWVLNLIDVCGAAAYLLPMPPD